MATTLLLAVSCILLVASTTSSQPLPVVHVVGEVRGWTVPAGNGTESYNHWAKKNHFQIGDILDFKYANDSVLEVNHDDYKQCSTDRPVSRFTDGDTKFKIDRMGPFFFVSGVPGHCEAGQRMIVRVMAQSAVAGAPAMAPSAGGADSPATSAPATTSTPTSGSSDSPSPIAEPSGASRRALTAGFLVVEGLVGVITLLALD